MSNERGGLVGRGARGAGRKIRSRGSASASSGARRSMQQQGARKACAGAASGRRAKDTLGRVGVGCLPARSYVAAASRSGGAAARGPAGGARAGW